MIDLNTLFEMPYHVWLKKTDDERRTFLEEQKDRIYLTFEDWELPGKWNDFIESMNKTCIEMRLQEYPSIHDLTVAQYEGDAREMHDIRNAVRNKYPKVIDTTD